jgi:acyl carrier protein
MDTYALAVRLLKSQLGPGYHSDAFDRERPLLGEVPELDSMAVVGLLTAVEEELGISIADDEVTADHFLTVGAFVDFVDAQLSR